MESNPLQHALETRLAAFGPDAVDNLIDSDFHANGFMLPPDFLRPGFESYLAARRYRPEAKGALAAREAVAAWHAAQDGAAAPRWAAAERVLLTASSSESYNLLFQAFTEPGDNVLIPSPGYPLFDELCRYSRIEGRHYPLSEASGWQPDLDVLDCLGDSRTRFLVLISPNNPCGSVIPDAALDAILDTCARQGIMVISDEVFSAFLYRPDPLPRPAVRNALRPAGLQVPVFTINGLSKLLASPDLKLSWLACSGPADALDPLVDELELRNDTFLNCNSLSQHLLPALLATADNFASGMAASCARNRAAAIDIAAALPAAARFAPTQGGIHGLICFSRYAVPDDQALAVRLLDARLYLHPGSFYHLDGQPALVYSLLKNPERFAPAFARLAAALSDLV